MTMLEPDIIAEIEELASRYPRARAACLDALLAVQRRHRWVSDAHLREVARVLGMSPDDLDGVASFYNLVFRRPVGEHVILACDSISCWMLGGERIAARIGERLGVRPGETTPDGRFTLLPICCLGDCDHAPALMIGEDLHHDLREEDVDALLGRYGGPQ